MKDLDSKVFKEIYDIINMANFTLDRNLLRCKILDVLYHRIYVESSVFFLPNKKLKSTGGIEKNIDDKYVSQYKRYFHRYDPIQLIKGPFNKKSVIQLEELIDYCSFVSSKFYCDFLRPQKIHHKDICPASPSLIRSFTPISNPRGANLERSSFEVIPTISAKSLMLVPSLIWILRGALLPFFSG